MSFKASRPFLRRLLFSLSFAFPLTWATAKAQPSPQPKENNWSEIEKSARGSQVIFAMWSGSDTINRWVDGTVSSELKARYGITLQRKPLSDAATLVNQLLGEKQAKRTQGTTDLAWINGENFKTLKKANALYGPFTESLPNFGLYYDGNHPANNTDFGTAVEGYEAPYGRAQFVFIYNSQKVPQPPSTLGELAEFCRKNPGRFTYPAPPDFTGSAFVRHVVYEQTGGYAQYLKNVDLPLLKKQLPQATSYLKTLQSCLWRKGETYPDSLSRLNQLFADGEVWYTMAYSPAAAAAEIKKGFFPASTRTFVLKTGTLSNTHFIAIPFNSVNVSAAKVVANFLLSPAMQLSKFNPDNWGDFPAISIDKLDSKTKLAFTKVDLGPATLPIDLLAKHQIPEISPDYLVEIEKAWLDQVVRKK